jgi:helix-turn-helix protein
MDHIRAHLENAKRNIEIIGADPATRYGFTQVPNFVLTNKDLSVGAKLAYAMLLKYAWTDEACFPGQQKLAEDMGSGERSVRTYLKELEDAKFLEVKQRGLGKTNLYRLFLTVKKRGQLKSAGPDRQNLPVQNGKRFRS